MEVNSSPTLKSSLFWKQHLKLLLLFICTDFDSYFLYNVLLKSVIFLGTIVWQRNNVFENITDHDSRLAVCSGQTQLKLAFL